jgi:8-oxo-dGTP diphosphatase
MHQHNNSKPIIKAASACVWRGDDVLLVQRASTPGKGRWSFPGGKCEPGEDDLAAAHRELWEETGVKAALRHRVGQFEIDAGNVTYHITCFTGLWLAGEAVAASDAGAVQWVHHVEINQFDLAPHIVEAVKLAHNLTSL